MYIMILISMSNLFDLETTDSVIIQSWTIICVCDYVIIDVGSHKQVGLPLGLGYNFMFEYYGHLQHRKRSLYLEEELFNVGGKKLEECPNCWETAGYIFRKLHLILLKLYKVDIFSSKPSFKVCKTIYIYGVQQT